MRSTARKLFVLALLLTAWPLAGAQETKDVFQGDAAEQFLKKARIMRVTDIPVGVTQPQKVTLQQDGVTRMAAFKIIDVDKPGATQMADGTVAVAFQDTWRTEIAAYEIDKIIGLGMVPATVERAIRGKVGSLQWWVESMMPEAERVKQGVAPPDVEEWNHTNYKMRLFDRLIYNVDRHLNNILVTSDFDLRLIDHSRSFRPFDDLREPEGLTKFSRSLLAGIERLEFEDLKKRVGRHLRDGQIRAMLKRRDLILQLAKARVDALGEAAVLYD
jgi:hypothetical protein